MAFIKVISTFLTRFRQVKPNHVAEVVQLALAKPDHEEGVTVFR